MAQYVKLRVIVEDYDFRRLDLPSGMPKTVAELSNIIRLAFGIERDFRIHYRAVGFNDEYLNLTSVQEIRDKSTIKLVYMPITLEQSPVYTIQLTPITIESSALASTSQTSPSVSSLSSANSVDTIIPSYSETALRTQPWPRDFPVPRFPYDVELQLQRGNVTFKETSTLLEITTGLKSAILERLAEQIFQYTAYPQTHQLEEVAEALIKKFPCLKESSASGFYTWLISLKHKMANYRTKMRHIGCPELTVNSLKNKTADTCLPAKNVKKPKKAEVNYCPSHPAGETDASLEKVRVELLNDVRLRNGVPCVGEKMSKTFSYRRKEVVRESPLIKDFKMRWPALFRVDEINAEFQRITTIPLEANFMAQLDSYVPKLTSVFQKKGGMIGQKLSQLLEVLEQATSVDLKRTAALKALCLYLGEDDQYLIRELMNCQGGDVLTELQKTSMGVYIMNREGEVASASTDIGIFVEGIIILEDIGSVARACALMLGVIYALNLAYPKDLRYYYEFIQKVLLQLDEDRLSPKVLALKNKLLGL